MSTVFVSQLSGIGVSTRPGQEYEAVKEGGFLDAWKALPKSVKNIIIIRDDPQVTVTTPACIEVAIARHRRLDRACALPRSTSLPRDLAAEAAGQSRSPRVDVIDLAPFMCDESLCYPVVGGALVHKDRGHLTRLFSTTLGPFLLREISRIMPSRRSNRR